MSSVRSTRGSEIRRLVISTCPLADAESIALSIPSDYCTCCIPSKILTTSIFRLEDAVSIAVSIA